MSEVSVPPDWSGRVVFSDVDHTLVTVRTLLSFATYYLDATGQPTADLEALVRRLRAGAPRARLNRDYFRLYAGATVTDVTALGQRWFDRAHRRGGLFHPPVRAALRAHRRGRDLVVLVSGSFAPCLEPIAEHVGAVSMGTGLEVVDGRYTGVVTSSMIGAGRERSVRRLIRQLGTTAGRCVAYGDHASDLALLGLVGRAVVVGGDPVLAAAMAHDGSTTFLPPAARPEPAA